MTRYDIEADFIVVGSGGGALTAAITAKALGLDVIVIEKTDKIGGTTAYSGGSAWIPNNPVSLAGGLTDSREEGLHYMEACISDTGLATSHARKEAYIDKGADMVDLLASQGFSWRAVPRYPDYYPERAGGSAFGRSIEGEAFDTNELGEWQPFLRANDKIPPLPIYSAEAADFLLSARTAKGFQTAARVVGKRLLLSRLRGKRLVTNGNALIGRLLQIVLRQQTQIMRNTPVMELLVENDQVTGVLALRDGVQTTIAARRGVLLAAGGFSRNLQMRRTYHKTPVDLDWTLVAPGDTGEITAAAMALGAATEMMERAWWMPVTVETTTNISRLVVWERSFPHSIVVDGSGKRFTNESAPYLDFGEAMIDRNNSSVAIPSWLVIDARHRRRYPFGVMAPGITPKSAVESGLLIKATTIHELAQKMTVDPAALKATVERFNSFAESGIDEDFARGTSIYDHFYGDPRQHPNPNLGSIEEAPFYAAKLWLGDIGTKGGLVTDEHGRVLREDNHKPILGLYATGNTTASVMGDSYPGPGATIGPSLVFGHAAAAHAGQSHETPRIEPIKKRSFDRRTYLLGTDLRSGVIRSPRSTSSNGWRRRES